MKHGAKNRSNARKILNNNNVHTHTHARTHACMHPPTHPPTLFFWLTNNLKHSINYNKTKFHRLKETQDPNTKRFKGTLIYYDIDTQYAHFRGNPLRQATK